MRILIPHTRELCYLSGSFFLDKIQNELELRGCEVDRIDLSTDDADYDLLESRIGKSYDAVFDINSRLPMLELESGKLLLDEIGAPFYHYIVDHPLFHYPSLMIPLQNTTAIAIDRDHQRYMEEFHPHHRSVLYHSIPGTQALNTHSDDEKTIDILFTGTYESSEKQLEQLNQRTDGTKELVLSVIELMQEGAKAEQALNEVCPGLPSDRFSYMMNRCYLADKYVRNAMRLELLMELAKEGLPLTVVGEGWDKTPLVDFSNVTVKEGVTLPLSFELISKAKLFIDINPLFLCGVHDRVPTAFANGAVCFTTMNREADPLIRDGQEAIYFSKQEVSLCAEKMRELLGNKAKRESLSEAGYNAYADRYTWSAFGDYLYQLMCQQ